ncbi:MAG: prevent-host-death protein [Crinalium sp.]
MPQIDIAQAQISLSELIEKVISGEEVVITKNDHAIVKLVAVAPVNQRRSHLFGSDSNLISISDDFDEPLEDFQDYM